MLRVIVGPIAETMFVRGWLLTGQEPMSFATNSSISIMLIALIVLLLAITVYKWGSDPPQQCRMIGSRLVV